MVGINFAKQAAPVVFGVVLMLIVYLMPGGAAGLLRRLTRPIVAAASRRS